MDDWWSVDVCCHSTHSSLSLWKTTSDLSEIFCQDGKFSRTFVLAVRVLCVLVLRVEWIEWRAPLSRFWLRPATICHQLRHCYRYATPGVRVGACCRINWRSPIHCKVGRNFRQLYSREYICFAVCDSKTLSNLWLVKIETHVYLKEIVEISKCSGYSQHMVLKLYFMASHTKKTTAMCLKQYF